MSTKFNIQDRHQGNTSFERDKELIRRKILKIDESIQKHDTLLRIQTIFSSLVETIDLYNPEEATRERSEIGQVNIKKQTELSAFNELKNQINLFIDLIDRMVEFCIKQKQYKDTQDVNDSIKADKEKEAQIKAFNQDTLHMLNKAKELREAILKSLYQNNIENIRKINQEIKDLNERINNINQDIENIKEDALHSYQSEIRGTEVNGQRLFEGKSNDDVNKITKELFEVHFHIDTQIELREIRRSELKNQYTEKRKGGSSTLEHQAWKSSAEFKQCALLDREITELKRDRIQKINKVLENNNILIPKRSRDVVAAITNTDQTTQAAKKVAKQEHRKQALVEEKKSKVAEKKELVKENKQIENECEGVLSVDEYKIPPQELMFELDDGDLELDPELPPNKPKQ